MNKKNNLIIISTNNVKQKKACTFSSSVHSLCVLTSMSLTFQWSDLHLDNNHLKSTSYIYKSICNKNIQRLQTNRSAAAQTALHSLMNEAVLS